MLSASQLSLDNIFNQIKLLEKKTFNIPTINMKLLIHNTSNLMKSIIISIKISFKNYITKKYYQIILRNYVAKKSLQPILDHLYKHAKKIE